MHLLSSYHLSHFIRFVVSIPEFQCVMAHPEAIGLANRLFLESEKNNLLEQAICYDTTFDLGEFYLSTLVIKNTDLVNDRILPIAFFLHNRKDTLTHKIFFDWAFNELKVTKSIPFITDREKSIVSNIIGHAVGPKQLFYCTNHILQDVKIWCYKNGMSKKLDFYRKQVHILVDKKSIQQFDEAFESMSVA